MIVRGVPSYFVLVVFGITNGNIYVFLSKDNTQRHRVRLFIFMKILLFILKNTILMLAYRGTGVLF